MLNFKLFTFNIQKEFRTTVLLKIKVLVILTTGGWFIALKGFKKEKKKIIRNVERKLWLSKPSVHIKD